MKIDVDGHEAHVLEGARKTLRSVSTVMVEADRDTAPSVISILSAAGLEEDGSWPRSGGYRNYLFRRPGESGDTC